MILILLWNITLWVFNIAMEHGPFIDGLPIKNDDCSMAMLNNQMVLTISTSIFLILIHINH